MTNEPIKNQTNAGFRPELFAAQAQKASAGKALPPVELWNPEFCGHIDMHIKRDGSWDYMGSPISRQRMVKLFSTILRRDDDGFYLVTPVEKVGIKVDDAPFVVVEMTMDGDQILFRTNVDDFVKVDKDHKIWVEMKDGKPAPYVRVRGRLDALINRNVYYQLADMAVEYQGCYGVWSDGQFFKLE